MRARVRRQLADQEGMFEDLRRAVEADPDVNWINLELGEEYRVAGRYEEAIGVFRRLLERDPDYHYALAGLGATHRALNAYAEALRYLDRALTASPDYGWAYGQRARVRLAAGRTEQALADLERCIALGTQADWARRNTIELLIRCGRWNEALARLAEVDRAARFDDGLDEVRAEAYRHTGQWAAARQIAERMLAVDPVVGTIHLALTVGGAQGLRAANSLWREVARLLDLGELDEEGRALAPCVVSWALGDWFNADRRLAKVLAADFGWDDFALFVDVLSELLHSPGADRSRLAPRLAAVVAARDAIQTRYAA